MKSPPPHAHTATCTFTCSVCITIIGKHFSILRYFLQHKCWAPVFSTGLWVCILEDFYWHKKSSTTKFVKLILIHVFNMNLQELKSRKTKSIYNWKLIKMLCSKPIFFFALWSQNGYFYCHPLLQFCFLKFLSIFIYAILRTSPLQNVYWELKIISPIPDRGTLAQVRWNLHICVYVYERGCVFKKSYFFYI